MNVFDRWKCAYDQLVSAMDNFVAGCVNLDSALQQPGASSWSELDSVLAVVDATVSSLEAHPKIRSARAILGAIRNRSRSLVPFNKLPADLIVYTMSFVNNNCAIDYYWEISGGELQPSHPLASVLLVNKPLRDLLIRTPSLWTHIDLFPTGPHETTYRRYAQACLKYSGESPLHVHIMEEEPSNSPEITSLVGLLGPHTHRIVSLYLRLSVSLQRKILLGLYEYTTSSRLKNLCLADYSPRVDKDLCDRLFDGRLDGLLQSLRGLAVIGRLTSLNGSVYRGLASLKLISRMQPREKPTKLQFTNVLAACPQLRVLALLHCVFEPTPGVPIQPVFLPNLELLDLRLAEAGGLLDILSCITLGPNAIAFGMGFDSDMSEREMATLEDFFKHSTVTRLCIDCLRRDEGLDWVFSFSARIFANVQELALNGFDLMGGVGWRPLDTRRFPALHTLHLLACQFDADICCRLLESSAVQTLQADRTSYVGDLLGVVQSVTYRTYSSLCEGENDLEWPICLV
ncbi:hypothetical protein FS749_005487 [Ceratobasidium sp. UAMH 11750]|nr:hypothetical protein FS749_005487 [Ceratobasidium sp. UAMH 11750]